MDKAALNVRGKVQVLYLDHKSHPAPLSRCYLGTASRLLSSYLEKKVPPSTLIEVESAYCSQCLAFWDATSAFGNKGLCKNGCNVCPVCNAVLSIAVESREMEGQTREGTSDGLVCMYKCGYCDWTSAEGGIIAPVESSNAIDDSDRNKNLEAAIKQLRVYLDEKIEKRKENSALVFDELVAGWKDLILEQERKKRQIDLLAVHGRGGLDHLKSSFSTASVAENKNTQRDNCLDAWCMETLDESLIYKKDRTLHDFQHSILQQKLPRVRITDEPDSSSQILTLGNIRTLFPNQEAVQTQMCPTAVYSRKELFPIPMPLRARAVRRCQAELEAGRPGILVKPKVNPLEGDSSLRFGHGQWWKKDSSAIHIVPRVEIVKYGQRVCSENGTDLRYALLLRIRNPTLGTIRLRLGQAIDKGSISFPKRLNNVILDSMTLKSVNATVIQSNSLNVDMVTDVITLEPIEDAFLELGKGQCNDPPEVEGWSADSVLNERSTIYSSGSSSEEPEKSLSIIAHKEDVAWVQFTIVNSLKEDEVDHTRSDSFVAVPLSLQIEVGNGSWESALIKPKKVKDGETDYVNFTIYPMWKVA